jgi:hypothetical protein
MLWTKEIQSDELRAMRGVREREEVTNPPRMHFLSKAFLSTNHTQQPGTHGIAVMASSSSSSSTAAAAGSSAAISGNEEEEQEEYEVSVLSLPPLPVI